MLSIFSYINQLFLYPPCRNVYLIISPFLVGLLRVLYIFWMQFPYQDIWPATKTSLQNRLQWAYSYLVTSCKSRTWILLDELLIFCSSRKRKTISKSSSVTELQKHDDFHVMKWFTCWSSLISCEVKCTLWGFTSSIAKGLPFPNVLTSTSSLPEDEKLKLSALNTANRWSEINSSTEDSSFLSPSIIQGVCGRFLEYLLYLPEKETIRQPGWNGVINITG